MHFLAKSLHLKSGGQEVHEVQDLHVSAKIRYFSQRFTPRVIQPLTSLVAFSLFRKFRVSYFLHLKIFEKDQEDVNVFRNRRVSKTVEFDRRT